MLVMLKRYYNVINHDKQDIIFPDIVRRIKINIISRFKSNGNNIAISRIFSSFIKRDNMYFATNGKLKGTLYLRRRTNPTFVRVAYKSLAPPFYLVQLP